MQKKTPESSSSKPIPPQSGTPLTPAPKPESTPEVSQPPNLPDIAEDVSGPSTPGTKTPLDPLSRTPSPGKSRRVDTSATSMERNFITAETAMSEFLLSPTDLEGLRQITRRSPYQTTPEIVVYSRKEVVARAVQVWGSLDKLRQERSLQILSWRRQPRDTRHHQEYCQAALTICSEEYRVVCFGISVNILNLVLKLLVYLSTRSHSIFAELLHSVADTANQIILAFGIRASFKKPSSGHPYGFSNMESVSALISGTGVFCVGTGLSLYHGYTGLTSPHEDPELIWQDPSVNVLLAEDSAAVLSAVIAFGSLGVSVLVKSSMPDAIGSIVIALILATVAIFIIASSISNLIGRSIPKEDLQRINSELENDVMVRAIHDVKGIDMGNSKVRYKAELDFDGRELTRAYLDALDMVTLLEDVKKIDNVESLERFMLLHGENLVDMIGGQIDRIERKLKSINPDIRHVDLEIL